MSTFLVCLGVVAVAIGVARVALSDPDQPATLRRDTGSAKTSRPAARRARPLSGAWVRLRSGLALVILVVFVGVVVAAMIGAGLALAARALTDAIG